MTDDSVRERLLKAVWKDIRSLNETNVLNYPAARRAVDAGASPGDLVTAMSAAAYEMAFGLLYQLSAVGVEEGNDAARTGWTIIETDLAEPAEPSVASSSDLASLHEDLLSADPTGAEGRDLFA